MGNMQLYILYSLFSVISGYWKGGYERWYAMEPCLQLLKFQPPTGAKPGTVRSVDL